MGVWTWDSPVAWAIFLVGAGVTVLLISLAMRWLSEIAPMQSTQKKR